MDEFESATENTGLVDLLRRRIDTSGPMTFHDYMEAVLYHPQLGYYATREPMGRGGDYLTSPEAGPVFGALVGRQLLELWETMGRPTRFDVVEQGAGRGVLARDLLSWASRRDPGFLRAIRYRLIEISPSLRRRQEQTLAVIDRPPGQIEWLDGMPEGIEGVVLSNELLDSFPVHRVVIEGGQLRELHVTLGERGFAGVPRPPSTPRIQKYFETLGLRPGDGCLAEVNLHAVDWMASVAQAIRRGYVLTLDYGHEARELYAPWRRDGTLLCFYHHNPSGDPFARIGKQDMTSHVDFTTLKRTGEANGLETAGFTTQARFLAGLGIGEALGTVATESPHGLEEYYARRRTVQDLLDPAGLGRIRVLAQRKGVPPADLAGFRESNDA